MRYSPIPSSLFADRRKGFSRKMIRSSVAIFCSSDPMPRNGDSHFPFRQDSDLFALSGLDQEGTIVVLCPDAKKVARQEMAFILPEDRDHAIWNGERLTLKQASRISGIRTIYTIDQWDRIMRPIFRDVKTIYVHQGQEHNDGEEYLSAKRRMAEKLKAQFSNHKFLPTADIRRTQAMIKHKLELDLMRTAAEVSGMAFERVLSTIQPGMKEFEVQAELDYILTRHGCTHAFEPIIASGASACTLHYVRNDRRIDTGDLVLLDFGAEYACMASDISRTIPASGRFSKRQKAIYGSVLSVLNEITAMMRPGITIPDLNKAAGQLLERELVQLKIISKRDLRRQDPKAPLYRRYFMHGIGHHLGYDVHDWSDRKMPLKPGMVITCEPGLYIPEEGIGIRLENDILITRGKPENLTKHIPIEPEEIEGIILAGKKEREKV